MAEGAQRSEVSRRPMLTYTEAVSIPNLAFPMVTLHIHSGGCFKIYSNNASVYTLHKTSYMSALNLTILYIGNENKAQIDRL
jgi:hypothetical protein